MNAKLTPKLVAFIRGSKFSDGALALAFDVSRLTILRARLGQTFQTVKARPQTRLKK